MDNEKSLLKVSNHLFNGISNIINVTRSRVAVYVNSQASMMFWHIGKFIITELNYETYSAYGDKILATLSQRLTEKYGKGYSYSALTRMIKVATIYNDEQMFFVCTLERIYTVNKIDAEFIDVDKLIGNFQELTAVITCYNLCSLQRG